MVQPPPGPPRPIEQPLEISPIGALNFLFIIASVPGLIMGGNPMGSLVRQLLNRQTPIEIPDPQTAVTMRLKGQLNDAGYQEIMLRHGFDNDLAVRVLNAAETILTPSELVAANFRGIINDGRFNEQMMRLGFAPDSANEFKEVSRFVAGPSDLVRFAVREVYTPEIVTALGLAAEFPSEFITAATTWGMSAEEAENFWKAHWVLPSVQQGFEMLHRRVKKDDGSTFVIEDMERLLKVQDVMPFFRGLLTQIAFRPFTRVDVRRMHKLGTLNREEVKSAYMDIGFDDEKAEAMTDFTIQFNTESDRDLTKSEIMRALDRGVIDESLAIMILDDIGLSQEAAIIVVATHQAKVAMDLTDELSDIEIDHFVDGMISETELQDALGLLDLTATQLELLMAKARKRLRRAEKMPSKADILKWFKGDAIDRDSADDLLRRIGYPSIFRDLYLLMVEGIEEI